jgi:hypothetical protein
MARGKPYISETAKAAAAKSAQVRAERKAEDVRMGISGELDEANQRELIKKLQRLSNSKDERIALGATKALADLHIKKESGDDGPVEIIFHTAYISEDEATWPPPDETRG